MKKILFVFMLIIGSIGLAREAAGERGQGANDFQRFQYEENFKDEKLAEQNTWERMSRMRAFKDEKTEPTYESKEFFLRDLGSGSKR